MAENSVQEESTMAQPDEFVFIEHKVHDIAIINKELTTLRDEVEQLQYNGYRRDEFLDKFFQVFIAFTVLVAPIAVAFAFSSLTDTRVWNLDENNVNQSRLNIEELAKNYNLSATDVKSMRSCPSKSIHVVATGRVKVLHFETDGEMHDVIIREHCIPTNVQVMESLRTAAIFSLIVMGLFIGLPYYFYNLDRLNNTAFMFTGADDDYLDDDDEESSENEKDKTDNNAEAMDQEQVKASNDNSKTAEAVPKTGSVEEPKLKAKTGKHARFPKERANVTTSIAEALFNKPTFD